jgi:2,3-bisphosphoglycerate-dependent phosphoglycerate mutase
MTTIYLVRHAHSTYSVDELGRGLSSEGPSTVSQITKHLINKNIDFIYSSPYARAIDTIKDLAHSIQRDIYIEDDFKERTVAKESVPNFEESLHTLWSNPTFSFEGGESNVEAQTRVIRKVEELLLRHEGKNIVISTHGNLLALLLNYYDKQHEYLFWKNMSMPDIYKLSYNGSNLHKVEHIWKEPFLIRPITEEDALTSLHLMNTIDAESPYMLYGAGERATSLEQQQKTIKSILKKENATMLLAIDNQTPVGYTIAIGGAMERTKHSAYLVIGILASHTNRGIGGALFKEVEKWARAHSITRMELTVMTNNERAVHLYKKRGFEIEGTKKQAFFLQNEYVNAYDMAKLLSPID